MDTSQDLNHFFESSLGSGDLIYVIDNDEPVCVKFCSQIKLKILFDVWSNASDDNKSDVIKCTSVLDQVDNSATAVDYDGSVSTDVVYKPQFVDHDDICEGDVSEVFKYETEDQHLVCTSLESKRSKNKICGFSDFTLSSMGRKSVAQGNLRSKRKRGVKQDNVYTDKIVIDTDLKQSSNVKDESQYDHENKLYSRKLRSSNKTGKLDIKISSATKTAKILLKSKLRKNLVKTKKSLSEPLKSPDIKSEHKEQVNQQVKEKQRKLLIEKTITCEYCMVDFKNQQFFYDHRRVEESSHTCGICGKVEPYEAHLIVHMQKHRRSKPSNNTESDKDETKKAKKEKMKCNICGIIVSSTDSLKIHSFLHTGEYAYRCCVCQETFSSLSSRQHHMDTHISVQRFKCNPCGQRFTSRADLAKHQLTHEIKCALCGEIFPNKTSRSCHFRVSHPNDILKCSLCSSLFATVKDLEKHLAYHKKGKKEQCPVCGVVVSKLKDHMLMHSHLAQEKLYACDQCPMRYLRKSNLDRHMRTHTGEKPYACNRCAKSFRSNGMLRKHLLTHTKERPYQCEVCGKQCSLRSNLNIHMRVHNSDRHFSCTLCSQTFNHKNSLHGHMKNKHTHEINISEMNMKMSANVPRDEHVISTPGLVSEFDKNIGFNDKHFHNLDLPVCTSQNTDSNVMKSEKFEKLQDFRQMQSHLNFPISLPENLASSLYMVNERMTLGKYDLNPQTSHGHGY